MELLPIFTFTSEMEEMTEKGIDILKSRTGITA